MSMISDDSLGRLKASNAHWLQLKMWQADVEAFEACKNEDTEELQQLRQEIYEVVSMYSAFQGVIFLAVAQTSHLSCELSWSPVSLSIIATFATALVVIDKIKSMREVNVECKRMGDNIDALKTTIQDLQIKGDTFDLGRTPVNDYGTRKPDLWLTISGLMSVLFICVLAAVINAFSVKTLCRHCK